MAKNRHIALTTGDPSGVAEFYKNLAILNWKTNDDADVGVNGPNFSGIHHIGFMVDDLDGACEKLEGVNGQALNTRDGLDAMSPAGPRNFEMKWAGPDGVVIDISHTGWATSK